MLSLLAAAAVAAETAQPAPAPPPTPTVFEAVEERQPLYPVGSARSDDGGMRMNFYVLGGLSTRGPPTVRTAVLVNVVTSPAGRYQVVEVGSLTCAARSFEPNFRAVYNAVGKLMASSGPIQDKAQAGTLLSEQAVGLTSEILCNRLKPQNVIQDGSLADFR